MFIDHEFPLETSEEFPYEQRSPVLRDVYLGANTPDLSPSLENYEVTDRKVPLEESSYFQYPIEESFDDYIYPTSTTLHQNVPDNFTNSPSGSENTSSPSPSPPLTSCPPLSTSVSTTPSPSTLLPKGPTPLLLNSVSQTAKINGTGSSIPQLLLIDSRPYLVNQSHNREISSKEVHHVQLRVIPPSHLQQPQQQLICKPHYVLKPQQVSKYSPQLLNSQNQSTTQYVLQQEKAKPQQNIFHPQKKLEQELTVRPQQEKKVQYRKESKELNSPEVHQQKEQQQIPQKHSKDKQILQTKAPQQHISQKQIKKQMVDHTSTKVKDVQKNSKLKQTKEKEKDQCQEKIHLQKPLETNTVKTSQKDEFLECSETLDDTDDEEYDEDNPLPMDESVPGGDSDYQPDQSCKDLESPNDDNHPSNSQSLSSDCFIPNLLNDAGAYGFKILLDTKEDTLKTPTWLVSNITKKLYTNMNKPIPFRVILKKPTVKKKFFLRAMAVFKYPMFLRQNVVRCPNHMNPLDSSNLDFRYRNHVIRADHPHAMYERSSSGRLSVVVPLDFPDTMEEAIPVLLKFMCHNSCVGGISRRPMAVLLTLENNSEEVGRYTIDVRVCACPSRDVKTEEKQAIAKGLCKKIGHVYEHRRNRKRPKRDDESAGDDDDQLFYLPVRGITLFNYLKDSKTMYLKHHPEYAVKYPDPPSNDLHWKIIEEMAPQNLISDTGEDIQHPESPNSSSSSSSVKEKQQRQQSVFVVYPKDGENEPVNLDSGTEVPADLKKSVLESLEAHLSGNVVSTINIKKERFIAGEIEGGVEEDGMNTQSEDTELPQLESRAVQQHKSSRKRRRRSSKDLGAQDTIESKPIKSKGNNSPKGSRRHLSVLPMPDQTNKKSNLITMVPLGSNREAERSKFDSGTLDEINTSMSTEESEKEMLAAQVLASQLFR